MVSSVLGSFLSLAWALVFMGLIMYLVAIGILQILPLGMEDLGDEVQEERRLNMAYGDASKHWSIAGPRRLDVLEAGTEDMKLLDAIAILYGSIPRCFLTLFYSISGGDWGILALPLVRAVPALGFLFIAYIAFMTFGVLNVLTGILVDTAMQSAQMDRNELIQAEVEQQQELVDELKNMFTQCDKDGSGELTEKECRRLLRNRDVMAYLHALGVNPSEAHRIFALLDADDSGTLDSDEFVDGLVRYKGQASAIDVGYMMFESKEMMKKQRHFMKYVSECMLHLDQVLDSMVASDSSTL
eukprot:gnl/TRDRNA2_/TRDRNA2_172513_c0_seq2.p1 gnl/TRDRNA2_/TRDRNA2_172513_c0~~gnl/TRDRNA2_/TRDRNA2_172513_c0_seq2.p1  ORF type:complete len:332 (-),score=59.62 gnl/TRDRNA2_/TRDRNA2_172513_c0_seq2:23-919(-)